MMKKVTIRLDDQTAKRARVQAVKHKISLSRYIRELLRKEVRHADEYEAAYRAWRNAKPFPLNGPPEPYPKRDEIYDRPVFRRR
jgi:plasmid stability protein